MFIRANSSIRGSLLKRMVHIFLHNIFTSPFCVPMEGSTFTLTPPLYFTIHHVVTSSIQNEKVSPRTSKTGLILLPTLLDVALFPALNKSLAGVHCLRMRQNEVGRATHSEYFVVGSEAVQLVPSLRSERLSSVMLADTAEALPSHDECGVYRTS